MFFVLILSIILITYFVKVNNLEGSFSTPRDDGILGSLEDSEGQLSPLGGDESFIIENTLAPAGASLEGTNAVGFDSSKGVYYFEFRDFNDILLDRYEINISNSEVQKGILKIRESRRNFFPVVDGGTLYRTPSGQILQPIDLALKSQINSFNHQQTSLNSVQFQYDETVSSETETVLLTKQYTFSIKGGTLIIEVKQIDSPLTPTSNYAGFTFGQANNVENPRNISIPYMEIAPITVVNNSFFSSTYIDWSLSNSNYYPQLVWSNSNSPGNFKNSYSSKYVARQSNTYNNIEETGYVSVSNNVEDLMMVPHRQPSPYRNQLDSRPVISVWNLWGNFQTSEGVLSYFHDSLGIDNLTVIYNRWSQNFCAPPHDLPAAMNLGGNEALLRLVNKAKSYGYLFALYEVYSDLNPSSPFWEKNQDKISLNSSGARRLGWFAESCPFPQNYDLSSDKSLFFAQNISPQIKETFNPNAVYTDVIPKQYMTNGGIDYSATNLNSSSIGATMQNAMHLFDFLHSNYNSPLFGEGGQVPISPRVMYGGLVDSIGGEIVGREFAPILPDYELKIIKPLMANQGMGMPQRWVGDGTIHHVGDLDIANLDLDKYNSMAISYGHTGYIDELLSQTNPLYYLSKYYVTEYYLFREIQERYLSSPVISVLYENSSGNMIDLNEALRQNLDFSKTKLRTSYSNGLVVYVNHGSSIWVVTQSGKTYYLPLNGWLAIAPDFIEYSALVDQNGNPSISGHRADYIYSPNYLFVNGRGVETSFGNDYFNNPIIATNILVIKPTGWIVLETLDPNIGGQFVPSVFHLVPSINRINPDNVINNKDNLIRVQGLNFTFTNFLMLNDILLDDSIYQVNIVNSTDITFVLPSGFSTGDYNLTVIHPIGQTGSLTSNSLILRVESPSGTGGSSSGGGSSGGGGGGGSGGPAVGGGLITQCNDGVDNDGDLLIDYPNDLGCSSSNDNSEIDSELIIGSTSGSNYTSGNSGAVGGRDSGENMSLIFWVLLVSLSIAIIIVFVLIIRHYRARKRIDSLTRFSNYSK